MSDTDQKTTRFSDPKDHLANERTYLAWIRTSIGIMAFGFVVEKFAIFVKQIALLLGKENLGNISLPSSHIQGYSSIFGVTLVSLGVLISLLAFVKYRRVEKQLVDNTYRPSMFLNLLLALIVLTIGIFLVIYLEKSF